MTVWNAVLLGLVHGIAEFLPISSSGHLSIVCNLFNISIDEHLFFNALLRLGTIISILIVYWQDVVRMFYEVISFAGLGPLVGQPKERCPAARVFIMIVLATLPLFLILPINDMLGTLYDRSIFIGIAIILTGCILFVSDKMTPGKKTGRSMTALDALIIGFCQCAATIPGLSRTGVTITAGIATGLRRDFAVNFSFLLSLPALLGASIMSFADAARTGVDWACVPAYLLGMAVAIVCGIGSIYLIRYISAKGKFGGFAYYCWVMGVLGIILSMIF